jgi:diadenosine tetraphosphate (Ap4A) HIT family hydrolase
MSTNTLRYNSAVPAHASCEFCDEFCGGTRNAFAARYRKDLAHRIVFETRNFKVLPTLGQIVPGYLLFISAQHYRTLGDLPIAQLRELDKLAKGICERLLSLYGDYLLFEHGSRADSAGGCGIYHAHLHAVPFLRSNDPVQQLKKTFPYDEIPELPALKHLGPDTSYLYYSDASGSQYVFHIEHLPSQYVRRLLAQAIGSDNWDWRQCGREEGFLATLSDVSALLATSSAR